MKNNLLKRMAIGGLLIGAVVIGSVGASGCSMGKGYSIANEMYYFRRQLQAHGEFNNGEDFTKKFKTNKQELKEKQSRGEVPSHIKNVNQFYDWKKQQEQYESDVKKTEDALKAQESKAY